MKSPYAALLLEEDADEEAIEQAYRRRVKETHPDHGGSAEEFQRVKAAYEALIDGDGDYAEMVGRTRDGRDRRSGSADGATGDGADGDGDADGDDEPRETHTVECLNYEVLADRGWSLTDDDLFERAAAADLGEGDWARFEVPQDSNASLLEAAEDAGCTWPYSCRGGACANCAVAVLEGDLSMPANHVLTQEMLDQDIRLSCIGAPVGDDLRVVYNVKHLPGLDELLLPPRPFEQARAND